MHQALSGRLKALEGVTLKHAHRFILRRWRNLQEVRRHALGWLVLVVALSAATIWQTAQTTAHYTQPGPTEGGTYTEGVFGKVDDMNPIFASTPAELSAARLLFGQLVRYDERGDIVGELAERWVAGADGKTYTIYLRANARWSDGMPLTAQDVLFTFRIIKDANSRSPLYSSWRNISVEQLDKHVVKFVLPTAYAPFMDSLTVGILPEHILGKLRPSELRNYGFNRAPTVTSGPFTFQGARAMDDQRLRVIVSMAANESYVLGAPKLSRFQLHAYAERDKLLAGFNSQEVAAVSDLTTSQIQGIKTQEFVRTESPLYHGTYAFLNMDNPVLKDVKIRRALQLATNRRQLINQLANRTRPLTGPLLSGQLGYHTELAQPGVDLAQANRLLDEAGWPRQGDGKRGRDGQRLKFNLITINSGDYPIVIQELINQWSQLGISFESQLIRSEDIQQNFIASRGYDILVYQIALGRDPDVYAYWHSSQASAQGFNLSQYRSTRADSALESARARTDPTLREVKYKTFTQEWLNDVPAIALYRPSLSYIQNKNVTSFTPRPLVSQTDRYFNVLYWSAGKEQVLPTL